MTKVVGAASSGLGKQGWNEKQLVSAVTGVKVRLAMDGTGFEPVTPAV